MKKSLAKRALDAFLTSELWQDAENRVLVICLGASVVLHLFLLGSLSIRNMTQRQKIKKNIEVIYQLNRVLSKPTPETRDFKAVPEKKWLPMPKIVTNKDNVLSPFPAGVGKSVMRPELPKMDGKGAAFNKQATRMPSLEGKRHVSVPVLNSEKITNPKYLNYQDRIRDKIRSRAYMYVDNPEFQAGEVYLTFVVNANGEVTAIKLIDEKTKANEYLRQVGLRSIKESGPFTPLPDGQKYPEVTFNVVISFETGE